MANKSVLELAVETGKWDSGLKKGKKALDDFTTASGGLQQALGKDSDKMQKFVQMMGSMDSMAKTAKGQMNDYKSTIEQLTMQYNRMTEAQQKTIGQDYLRTIDQLRQKYQAVNQEVQQMNRSLKNVEMPEMKGGGLFSGMGDKMSGALQVFGGNMLTKAAGAVAQLGSEMYDMVKQGVELAKQGEGIRIAFERLGRGDILDGLRKATHGTVTDLELMKAAVKFNDFKLPLDELGTMLAFAQQKAKDTGQSVDYMVDSIVTGLGRKSLMILDNLGLSATEVKEKMAETGDMTKAVGAIIREQMSKAGDYVETAADRAAQANVSLQNKMEELGRKFGPVEEASNQLWTSMKIGILDIIGGPLARLLNSLTEAGRLKNALNDMNGDDGSGNTKVGQQLKKLQVIKKAGGSNYMFNSTLSGMMEDYNRQIIAFDAQIKEMKKKAGEDMEGNMAAVYESRIKDIETKQNALKVMRNQLAAGAKELSKPVDVKIETKGAEQNVESLKLKLIELEAQRKKAIAAGDTDLSKNLAKQISQVKADIKGLGGTTTTTTTHKTTPQETAANKVKEAERIYSDALLKNSIRLEAGIDKELENKKKALSAQERLFDAYNDAYATYADPKYKQASMEAADKIRNLADEVKAASDAQDAAKKATQELELAQKKLADAQQKLSEARATGSATSTYKAQQEVNRQQTNVDAIKMRQGSGTVKMNVELDTEQSRTAFESLKQAIQSEIKLDQMTVDEATLHSLLTTAIQNGIDSVNVDFAGLQEKIAKGIDIPDSTWKELEDEINEKLANLGIKPINIDFKKGGLSTEGKNTEKAWSLAAQAISSVGDAFNNIEDPGVKAMGTITQAIASIALGFAQASVTAASLGPFGWVAFLAAGAAALATTIGTVHSLTNLSEGGFITGNSYSGDNIKANGGYVGLNAGELVLNAAQQNNLANRLMSSPYNAINLEATIKGEDITLSTRNRNRRLGRGEYVTSKTRGLNI